MDERKRDEQLRTQEMAGGPARSTQDLKNTAEHAERRQNEERWGRPHEGEPKAALFPDQERDQLRNRWNQIQSEFVDEPRHSVEEADGLVAQTIKRLAESFAGARTNLEGQWARGGDVSTEDLRVAFQRYRSFFDRLLAV